jgi:hypothetical protein
MAEPIERDGEMTVTLCQGYDVSIKKTRGVSYALFIPEPHVHLGRENSPGL